jgi:hypothetical protein
MVFDEKSSAKKLKSKKENIEKKDV